MRSRCRLLSHTVMVVALLAVAADARAQAAGESPVVPGLRRRSRPEHQWQREFRRHRCSAGTGGCVPAADVRRCLWDRHRLARGGRLYPRRKERSARNVHLAIGRRGSRASRRHRSVEPLRAVRRLQELCARLRLSTIFPALESRHSAVRRRYDGRGNHQRHWRALRRPPVERSCSRKPITTIGQRRSRSVSTLAPCSSFPTGWISRDKSVCAASAGCRRSTNSSELVLKPSATTRPG